MGAEEGKWDGEKVGWGVSPDFPISSSVLTEPETALPHSTGGEAEKPYSALHQGENCCQWELAGKIP